jgi:hypothetical protein
MNDESLSPIKTSEKQDNDFSLNTKITYGFFGMLAAVFIGLLGFSYIKGMLSGQSNSDKKVLATTSQITYAPVVKPSPTIEVTAAVTILPTGEDNVPSAASNKSCDRYGYAQKWEYLTSYTIQPNDTLQSIATAQLHDPSRVNEIVQLNGAGPYVVGTTLYLPPPSITKSSGNLKEVYGLLIDKNASFWHISFSSDSSGLGILIPSYWFNDIANSNSFIVGDCIKVLFDDGNKVFSAVMQ